MTLTLTQDTVREHFQYDPVTGVLLRQGKRAGTVREDGHRSVCFQGRQYKSTTLIWIYMTGKRPTALVDHKNRDPADDHWGNLRLATVAQNQANRGAQTNNTSGYKGVFRSGPRWRAAIGVAKKYIHLGTFNTPKQAHAAYCEAAKRYFGEYACGVKMREIK